MLADCSVLENASIFHHCRKTYPIGRPDEQDGLSPIACSYSRILMTVNKMVTGRSDISPEPMLRVLVLLMSPTWSDSSRLDTRMIDLSLKTQHTLLLFAGKELWRFRGTKRVARPGPEEMMLLLFE